MNAVVPTLFFNWLIKQYHVRIHKHSIPMWERPQAVGQNGLDAQPRRANKIILDLNLLITGARRTDFVLNNKTNLRRKHHGAPAVFRTATTHRKLLTGSEESPEKECATAFER